MSFDGTEIDNGALDNYIIARKTVNGKQFQGVILAHGDGTEVSAADPIPVEGTLTVEEGVKIYVPTRPSFATGTEDQVFPANASRKAGSFIANNTNFTFFLAFGGGAAVLSQGQPLFPGQVWKFDSAQEIRGVFSGTGTVELDCLEAT